jgi:alpha-L-rhamnosidase
MMLRVDGHGNMPADPAWGAAYTLLADMVGRFFADDEIFRRHYTGLTAHMEELIRTASNDHEDGLLPYSRYSDWCPPQGCVACRGKCTEFSCTVPPRNSALVSSFYYITELRIMARYALLLRHQSDYNRYAALAANATHAFQNHFFDSENATYRESGRTCKQYLSAQTAISLASELGVIPAEHYDAVIATLVQDVARRGYHLDVGIIGVKYLLSTLSKAGRGDVALMIMQAKTPPSYIYMVQQGATTLWETWTGSRYRPQGSWNHIMFGSNSEW